MKRRRGFTLIEVLIVVIILGILATLALPQFTRMRKRAYLAEAWAALGGIRTAQAVYYMEYGEYSQTANLSDLDFEEPSAGNFTYNLASANATYFNALAEGDTGTGAEDVTAWIDSTGAKDSDVVP